MGEMRKIKRACLPDVAVERHAWLDLKLKPMMKLLASNSARFDIRQGDDVMVAEIEHGIVAAVGGPEQRPRLAGLRLPQKLRQLVGCW